MFVPKYEKRKNWQMIFDESSIAKQKTNGMPETLRLRATRVKRTIWSVKYSKLKIRRHEYKRVLYIQIMEWPFSKTWRRGKEELPRTNQQACFSKNQ